MNLNIEDTLTNKISFYHLLFFLVTLPFDRFYCELILVSFFIHTMIHLKKGQFKGAWSRKVLILQSIYLLTIIGSVYTSNFKQAFSDWGRLLVAFLFPILFELNGLNFHKYQFKLLTGFSLSVTIIVLYLYFDALNVIIYNHFPISYLFSYHFINQNFSKPIDIHATYFSFYVALSLNYYLLLFIKSRTIINRILLLMGSAILWCGLVQLGCKSIWFTELLILNILIPFYCYSSSNRIKAALVTLMVSSIAVIAILNLGSFRNRYVDGLKTEWSTEAITTIADPRIERWKAAIELIWSSPIVGYGSGDEVDLLKAKYFQKKLYDSYLHHLNAHNQYLSIWIKFGIIGLLVYLYTLLYGYKLALQSRNILFLSFLLLITIVSFSESILDANKSLFFYSFFFSFFVFSCRPEQRLQ